MENNKLTQELLKSLKRIAEGIEHSNKLEEAAQKKSAKLHKLQEKKAILELKEIQEKRNTEEITTFLSNELNDKKDGLL